MIYYFTRVKWYSIKNEYIYQTTEVEVRNRDLIQFVFLIKNTLKKMIPTDIGYNLYVFRLLSQLLFLLVGKIAKFLSLICFGMIWIYLLVATKPV